MISGKVSLPDYSYLQQIMLLKKMQLSALSPISLASKFKISRVFSSILFVPNTLKCQGFLHMFFIFNGNTSKYLPIPNSFNTLIKQTAEYCLLVSNIFNLDLMQTLENNIQPQIARGNFKKKLIFVQFSLK